MLSARRFFLLATVVAFVLLLPHSTFALAVIFVSSQNQPSSTQNERQEQQANPTVSRQEATAHNDAQDSKNDPKWWYKFIAWPEGIATIALIFTLAAIIWQSYETRRAAKAANKSIEAFIRSERAWVIVDLIPMGYQTRGGWAIKEMTGGARIAAEAEILRGEHLRHRLSFTNMGRTAARIRGYQIHYGYYDHKTGILRIEHIRYDGDFERMLGAGESTGIIPEITLEIHDFVNNPAAGISAWVYWMVVLVVVNYEHIFSAGGENEGDIFRFVYDPKRFTLKRSAITEADKEQARNLKMWPKLGAEPSPNPN
jgi:hypothetical protein